MILAWLAKHEEKFIHSTVPHIACHRPRDCNGFLKRLTAWKASSKARRASGDNEKQRDEKLQPDVLQPVLGRTCAGSRKGSVRRTGHNHSRGSCEGVLRRSFDISIVAQSDALSPSTYAVSRNWRIILDGVSVGRRSLNIVSPVKSYLDSERDKAIEIPVCQVDNLEDLLLWSGSPR